MAVETEVVRQALDALFRRDADEFVSFCSAKVVWEENTPVFPGLRPRYEGRDELREWVREAVLEAWSDLDLEDHRVDSHDPCVLLDMTFKAQGATSGAETRLRIWQVFWFLDGQISRRRIFLDERDALAAVKA